jgi:hypothetical protein
LFTIINPYEQVDWSTYNQYKAAFHVHSTNSDGSHTVARMAERHYDLGYNIVAFTDHDVITECPTKTPQSSSGGHNGNAQEPLSEERLAQMSAGVGRGDSRGMIFMPNGNERSQRLSETSFHDRTQHVNTFWSTVPNGEFQRESVGSLMRRMAEDGEGFARLNHVGRNTNSRFKDSDSAAPRSYSRAAERSNNPVFVAHYAELFRLYPRLIGMEIINEFDNESQTSEVMWDNILKELMPDRPVWGFSDDDSHTANGVGWSYNLMLMPELSLEEVYKAKESGAFLAFTRVDRRYDIYAGTIVPDDTRGSSSNIERVRPTLSLPTPEINNIVVGNDSVMISAANYEFINWYADGILIHSGAVLDLAAHASAINGYVRATVGHSDYGVLYTQPFGTRRVGGLPSETTVTETVTVTQSSVTTDELTAPETTVTAGTTASEELTAYQTSGIGETSETSGVGETSGVSEGSDTEGMTHYETSGETANIETSETTADTVSETISDTNGEKIKEPYSFTIHDALEILKYIAGIPSIYDDTDESPTIDDALEILKWIAGIPGRYSLVL